MNFPIEISAAQIDAKHPTWKDLSGYWERLRKLYEGGKTMHDWATEFLLKRSMEPFDVYNDRIQRFFYNNHMGSIAGWYVDALFKDPPSVIARLKTSTGAEGAVADADSDQVRQLAGFQDNCDGAGKSVTQFWAQDVEPKLLLYRFAYVLFDLPVAPEVPSKAAQKEIGALQPHLVAYCPQDIINWSTDERGNLDWVVLKLRSVTQSDPLQKAVVADRWYIFTRQEVLVYEYILPRKDDGSISSDYSTNAIATLLPGYPTPHALADQNIVPMFLQELHPNHWIADRIGSPLIKLLNLENSYHWSLEQTNLALLCVYSEREIDKVSRGEASFLQMGSTDKVEYLEQNGKGFDASQRAINELREEIYRLAYLVQQGRSSSATAASQSGVSKEADMMPARDVLSSLGEHARLGMQRVLQAAADCMELGLSVDVQGLDFLDRSELADMEVIERATTITTINSPTFEREIQKLLTRKALKDANREVFAEIDQEIENNPTANEMQQQQLDQANAMKLQQAVRLASPKAFEDVEE